MNISLTRFCKENGLSKTTVFNRCQELGISTSQGLSVDAIAQLRHEFELAEVVSADSAPESVEVQLSETDRKLAELMQLDKPKDRRDESALQRVGYQDVNALSTADLLQLAIARKNDNDALSQALSDRIEANEQESKKLKFARVGVQVSNDQLEEDLIMAAARITKQRQHLDSEKAALANELTREQTLGKSQQASA